jgi:hypothetical protein
LRLFRGQGHSQWANQAPLDTPSSKSWRFPPHFGTSVEAGKAIMVPQRNDMLTAPRRRSRQHDGAPFSTRSPHQGSRQLITNHDPLSIATIRQSCPTTTGWRKILSLKSAACNQEHFRALVLLVSARGSLPLGRGPGPDPDLDRRPLSRSLPIVI